MSIRAKLTIAFVLIALAPMAVLGYIMLDITEDELRKQILTERSVIVEERSKLLRNYVDHFVLQARTARVHVPIPVILNEGGGDEESLRQALNMLANVYERTMRIDGQIRSMSLTDLEGNAYLRVDMRPGGEMTRAEDVPFDTGTHAETFFADIADHRADEIHVSSFHRSDAGEPIAFFGGLVFSEETGEPEGVLVIEALAEDLFENLRGIVDPGFTAMIDESGRYLLYPERAGISARSGSAQNFFKEHPELENNIASNDAGERSEAGTLYVWQNIRFDTDDPSRFWTLISVVDPDDLFAPITSMRATLFLIAAAVLILSVAAALFVSRSISHPIKRLVTEVQDVIASGNKDRVDIESGGEVARLATAFNDMADQLQEYYAGLEQEVEKRTKEVRQNREELEASKAALEEKIEELEKFQDLTVGRELEMIELKRRLGEIRHQIEECEDPDHDHGGDHKNGKDAA